MSTIAAISTAPGIGGIGIVRISGEDTYKIIKKIFVPKKTFDIDNVKGYTIKYGTIINDNEIVDEVLVSFFKAPNSYTTENLCEISSHGGVYVVKKILETCLKNGAELAEPGEFTKRAFLNGRIDLSQAEAVIDVINAKTEKEAKSSINQLEGDLANKIQEVRQLLLSIMVEIEVSIDYPEYDIEDVTDNKTYETLNKVKQKLFELEKSFDNGKIIKDGIKIALIGKPNAGKSSLLNTILKEERAIVTDIEGTTRDTIEESVSIKGIPIHVIDTAGIRNTENKVEKIGIEKSKKIATDIADLVIAIFDSSRKWDIEDEEILDIIKNKKSIVILNKSDVEEKIITKNILKEKIPEREIIEISAKNKTGIEDVYNEIERLFDLNEINLDNSTIVTNVRHKNIILKAIEQANKAIEFTSKGLPIDIMSIHIKDILEELGKITGETVSDEIIKEIFAKFCLGK